MLPIWPALNPISFPSYLLKCKIDAVVKLTIMLFDVNIKTSSIREVARMKLGKESVSALRQTSSLLGGGYEEVELHNKVQSSKETQ
jgi:hypothetical protein